ncbi:MAG: hypothetical protein F6K54_27695 [Okeania sp. SIO3B5]|uniref:hypothetical protein n=1 Tax=Okeania sp. SIO3B5 TaxID=2607811 RepID=UPI0013FF76BA|nr:hypothetical protein [Okeania sp. SIO3B5]NEO56527.1 hypothetical protein [Okeania sp. SIO3B5]
MITAKKLFLTTVGTAIIALSTGIVEAATTQKIVETHSFLGQNNSFQVDFDEYSDETYITETTLDLSPSPNASFDLDNRFFSPGELGFASQVSNTNNTNNYSISNLFVSNNQKVLTSSFARETFSANNLFNFGINIDFFVNSFLLFNCIMLMLILLVQILPYLYI